MQLLRAYSVYFLKVNLNVTRVLIHTDGAARGNPGPAAIGAVIKDTQGQTLAAISRDIGVTTNNQAEYRAVIAALEKAIALGVKQVTLYSDSELLVRQISGRYKIKNTTLRQLYQEIVKLIGNLESFSVTCIPREQNAEADRLANKALEARG